MNATIFDGAPFVARVARGIGATSHDDALAAIRATIAALSEVVDEETSERIQASLPASLRAVRIADRASPPITLDALFARIAHHEGVSLGFAREHGEVVCLALAEAWDDEQLERITRRLSPALAALFRPKSDEAAPPDDAAIATAGHTLATGRPGSHHPVSESRPLGAHAHSVAERNPHADSKLSSARGFTQERREHALANAKEDEAERKISKASS